MKETIKVDEYRCDGCGRSYRVHEGEEPPTGWHGSFVLIDAGGGDGATFYACREQCLRRAIVGAMVREHDERHPQ